MSVQCHLSSGSTIPSDPETQVAFSMSQVSHERSNVHYITDGSSKFQDNDLFNFPSAQALPPPTMGWNTITAAAMAAACLSFGRAAPFPNNDGHKPTSTALHPSATSTSDHSSKSTDVHPSSSSATARPSTTSAAPSPSPTSSDVPSGPGRFIRWTDPEGVDACLQVNSPSFGTRTIGM